MGFFAHCEGKCRYRLTSHLALVATKSCEAVAQLPKGNTLATLAVTAGFAHDFGKYTSFFQKYLLTGVPNPFKEHAFLSSIWAVHLSRLQNLGPKEQLLVFLAVLFHHRNLDAPEKHLVAPRHIKEGLDFLDPSAAHRLEIAKRQTQDLATNLSQIATSLKVAARWTEHLLVQRGLALPPFAKWDWQEVLQQFLETWQETYTSLHRHWRKFQRSNPQISDYFAVTTVFSALIDSDKHHSARTKNAPRANWPAQIVSIYKQENLSRTPSPINILREEVFHNTTTRMVEAPLSQRFFTLTAPTGSGKTLAVLNAAFILRERIRKKRGVAPRIIYALPFTSIIDQTYEVLENVFASAIPEFRQAPSPFLLKHHHLAEISYHAEEEDPRSFDEAMLLIESWQSEVIVTTFVQLLHTLIGYRNRMLKKLCHLAGAIIIMDEVQNIPVEYWPLVTSCLKAAAEELDLRLILMTATRPEWFDPDEAWELGGTPEEIARFFSQLDRVRLIADTSPRTVTDAAAVFLEQYNPSNSYLVVLNTIRSSITFYECLKDALSGRCPLYYLSTNIVPAERERRLALLKQLLTQGEKPVVVSTQVVEAGVDLDFDLAWRDIGPLDAVVQVAGRCNRHFRRSRSDVFCLNITDEKGNPLSNRVYGNIHIMGAHKFFTTHPEISEPQFHELVGQFFAFVSERKDTSKSSAILRAMKELRFQKELEEEGSVANFQLIQHLPNHIEVFVAIDEKAEEIWQWFQQEVIQAHDIKSRRQAFYRLKRDFCRYLLSVPAQLLVGKVNLEKRLPYIPRYLAPELYDPETGFKRVEEGATIL